MYTWGRGDYGQLGRDIRSEGASQPMICCPTPIEVPTLENVRRVSDVVSSHHSSISSLVNTYLGVGTCLGTLPYMKYIIVGTGIC